MFSSAKVHLDAKRESEEEILRFSKDITWEAKRIIFTLHRVAGTPNPETTQTHTRLQTLLTSPKYFQGLSTAIANSTTPNAVHHHRRISPCLQEYTEAALFHHFLATNSMATYADLAQITPTLQLPLLDYILGLCDFTGELMKAAVATQRPEFLCRVFILLRQIYASFSDLTAVSRDFKQKLGVMRESVVKIEDAVYRVFIKRE